MEKLSRRVPEKGRICVSTEKWWNPGEYREKLESIRVSKNFPGEYQKMVKSNRVPGKGRIPASIEKLSRGVPKKGRIYVSNEIWWNPGEYQEKAESQRVSKNSPGEYRKRVEYV